MTGAGDDVSGQPFSHCTTCGVDLADQDELNEHVEKYHWIDRD